MLRINVLTKCCENSKKVAKASSESTSDHDLQKWGGAEHQKELIVPLKEPVQICGHKGQGDISSERGSSFGPF